MIGLPEAYVTGSIKYMKLGTSPEYDRKEWEDFHKSDECKQIMIGGRLRGIFDDKQKAIDIILSQTDSWGLCESFYTYIVLEKHYANTVDGCSFSEDSETWFKFEQKEPGSAEGKYVEIPKPQGLEALVGFA